ncbi:hypothetical protein PybrP1_005922 [[Pythium] brassicae (nom. inval.)]|nr:hypothetical protein PybrP1_005922 [[Pythium] brassicae (nom. inval.)]
MPTGRTSVRLWRRVKLTRSTLYYRWGQTWVSSTARQVRHQVDTKGTAGVPWRQGPTARRHVHARADNVVTRLEGGGVQMTGGELAAVDMVVGQEKAQRGASGKLANVGSVNILSQNVRGFAGRRKGFDNWVASYKAKTDRGILDLTLVQERHAWLLEIQALENRYAQDWGLCVGEGRMRSPSGQQAPDALGASLYWCTRIPC